MLRLLALAAMLAFSGSASAHSPLPGMNRFYGGMLHPLLVPAHAMAIVVMGLWLGRRWPANGAALLAFALAMAGGMVVGAGTAWQPGEWILLTLAAAVGLAVAADRQIRIAWLALLAAAVGAILGVDSIPDGTSASDPWLSLAGTWLAVLVGLSAMIVLREAATAPWMNIGLRVIASWVAAAAILVLALSLAGPRAKKMVSAPLAPPAAATERIRSERSCVSWREVAERARHGRDMS